MSDWMKFYYASPTPDRFEAELRSAALAPPLAQLGMQVAVGTFFGLVMARHPERVRAWLVALSDLEGHGRTALEIAACTSQLPEADAWLTKIGSRFAGRAPIDLFNTPIVDGSVLDALWSHYFATGEARAVRRIVTAFEYLSAHGAADAFAASAKTEDDRRLAMQDAIYRAASWSLTSLMREHAPLAALCESYVDADLTPNERISVALCLEHAFPERWHVTIDPAKGTGTVQRLAH